jgi:transcriptional regulator with XRE-family HTH domain
MESVKTLTRQQGSLGSALRRWRLLNRVKQAHLAEVLGISQATVSRWETGTQAIEPDRQPQVEALLSAAQTSSADEALFRLVRSSAVPVHLIGDVKHELLAASPQRALGFGRPLSELLGKSLRPFATSELAKAEARLPAIGWYDFVAPPHVEIETGENGSTIVPIVRGRCRWTRLTLSSGAPVRLVETVASA